MDEEDDDLYDPTDAVPIDQTAKGGYDANKDVTMSTADAEGEDEEEEEEEEEEDEYDIITEAPQPQPQPHSEPTTQPARQSVTREAPRPTADGASAPTPSTSSVPPKAETPRVAAAAQATKSAAPQKPGSAYPAQHTSTIDVNANPIHPTTGKPVLSTDLDKDFGEDDMPWRRPGSDITDYFNYGFDEFTWASYCLKQQEVRKEVGDQKKQLDDMQSFLGMPGGGMPGMPAAPPPSGTPGPGGGGTPGPPHSTGPQPGMPTIPGMPEMSQDMMQAMLTGMMSQGLDPSSMDPMTFVQHAQAMMGSGQPGGGGGPPQGGQPGFGGQPPQGYGGQVQQMGYGGYDQRGGFGSGGRGKGMRRW